MNDFFDRVFKSIITGALGALFVTFIFLLISKPSTDDPLFYLSCYLGIIFGFLFEDLADLAAFNGKETITELMPKAYSALTIYNKVSRICREYGDIMFLLLGDYALQRIDQDSMMDYENPEILQDEPQAEYDAI